MGKDSEPGHDDLLSQQLRQSAKTRMDNAKKYREQGNTEQAEIEEKNAFEELARSLQIRDLPDLSEVNKDLRKSLLKKAYTKDEAGNFVELSHKEMADALRLLRIGTKKKEKK